MRSRRRSLDEARGSTLRRRRRQRSRRLGRGRSLRKCHQADRSAHEQADRPPRQRQRVPDQHRSRLRLALGVGPRREVDPARRPPHSPDHRHLAGQRDSGTPDRRTRSCLGPRRHRARPSHRSAALTPPVLGTDGALSSLTPQTRRREARAPEAKLAARPRGCALRETRQRAPRCDALARPRALTACPGHPPFVIMRPS